MAKNAKKVAEQKIEVSESELERIEREAQQNLDKDKKVLEAAQILREHMQRGETPTESEVEEVVEVAEEAEPGSMMAQIAEEIAGGPALDADEVDETQMAEAEAEVKPVLQGRAKIIYDVLTTRIDRVRQTKGDAPAKKFETERNFLVAHAAFFESDMGRDADLNALDKIAIYAMQKVRKIIQSKIDGYSLTLLRNVEPLKKASIPFTAELQNAALSASAFKLAKDQNKNSLVAKRDCDPTTANTQSSSSRAAFVFLGFAKENKGRNMALEVNTSHPVWKSRIRGLLKSAEKSA